MIEYIYVNVSDMFLIVYSLYIVTIHSKFKGFVKKLLFYYYLYYKYT